MELKYRKQISKEVYDALRHVEGQLDNIKLDQSTTYYMEVYQKAQHKPATKRNSGRKKRRSINQWLTLASRDMNHLSAKAKSAQQVKALHILYRAMDRNADGPTTYRSSQISEHLRDKLQLKSTTNASHYVTQLVRNGILVEVSDYNPEKQGND